VSWRRSDEGDALVPPTSRWARFVSYWRQFPVSWATVAVVSVVIAYADGFGLTTLQGAIGAVERHQPPFERWLRDSTIMLPIVFVAVVGALVLARKLVEHRRGFVKFGVSALLIFAATTAVGILEYTASSAYDYRLQTEHLDLSAHLRHPTYVIESGTPVLVGDAKCNATCKGINATRSMHIRALGLASVLMVIANFVLVLWALALCGARIWVPKRAVQADATEPAEPLRLPAMSDALI